MQGWLEKKKVDEGDFAKCLDRRPWTAKLPMIKTTDDPRIGNLLRTKDDYRDAAVTLKVLAKALLGDHSGAVDMVR